jgi:hypothetical protein
LAWGIGILVKEGKNEKKRILSFEKRVLQPLAVVSKRSIKMF